VNLEYPLEITTGLLNAIESSEYVPSVRQQILNQEAGVDLFVSTSNHEAEIKSSLEDTWKTGALFISVQEAPQLKAALEGNPPEGMEWLQSPTMQQILRQASPLLKEHIVFFKDDVFPDVVTTLSMWDKKWHYKVVIGFRPLNIYYLHALATFRDAVGFFPTEPTFSEEQLKQQKAEIRAAQKKGITIIPFEEAFDSPGEAAFNQAWEPYATQETRNLDAPAWQAYDEIMNGRFLDEDSRREKLAGR
jgi:hypothetical protein